MDVVVSLQVWHSLTNLAKNQAFIRFEKKKFTWKKLKLNLNNEARKCMYLYAHIQQKSHVANQRRFVPSEVI